MNPSSWTEAASAVASAVSAVAAVAGVTLTLGGLLFIVRQLRQVERSILGGTNTSLCGQSLEILKVIADCPNSYACFYDNAPWPADPELHVRVACICEMVANYLDNVCLQRDNLLPPVWDRWKAFVRDTVKTSAVVREHLRKYGSWYSPVLLEVTADLVAQLPESTAP